MTQPTETAKQVNPIWKCEVKDCDTAFPPTAKGHRQMQGHQLKHANEGVPKGERGYHLEDTSTGEVLARSIQEAIPFLVAEMPKEPKKVERLISETPPRKIKKVVTPPKEPEAELIVKKEVKEEAKTEVKEEAEPPEEIPEAEEVATKSKVATVKSVGIFTYEITLPADAFVLFDLAKATGLEPNDDKLFDEWVWDCIRKRYEKDYKKQLILAPLEE